MSECSHARSPRPSALARHIPYVKRQFSKPVRGSGSTLSSKLGKPSHLHNPGSYLSHSLVLLPPMAYMYGFGPPLEYRRPAEVNLGTNIGILSVHSRVYRQSCQTSAVGSKVLDMPPTMRMFCSFTTTAPNFASGLGRLKYMVVHVSIKVSYFSIVYSTL